MNFNLERRTIYLVRHGSHAYGTNIETSDEDQRGVCIPTDEYFYGLQNFEQSVRTDPDVTIFSLKKFAALAADCNPNVVEILFVHPDDVLKLTGWGRDLLDHRSLFVTKKAKHTFSGYAHAQLKKIKTHRNWLLNPPKKPPERKDLGLPDNCKFSKAQLGVFENLTQEELNLLSAEAQHFYQQERAYQNAFTHWTQYQNWKNSRNPKRAETEAKYGYDTKHAMHLIRLMRMCNEILRGEGVIVRRPDAEELKAIRRGSMTYEQLVEMAEALDKEAERLYATSQLPNAPDRVAINDLIVEMTYEYLIWYGE